MRHSSILTICICLLATGCQDLDAKSQLVVKWLRHRLELQEHAAEQTPPVAPVAQVSYERPAQVATDTPQTAAESFLDAIRFGDQGLAHSLLTSAAQVAVEQRNRAIGFPGSPAAVHHVGSVEFPEDNVAHVWCTWCDASTNHQHAARLVLIQRHELPGWRVAGLVFLDANGDFGDIVNFEER